MTTSDLVASVSAGAAVLSTIISLIAVYRAGMAQSLSEKMFKRQGVIDLHMAWQGINQIDPNNLITPDVVKAVSALELTAALWNHDVIEKVILSQSYWRSYQELVDTLRSSQILVPSLNQRCCDLITSPVKRAYKEMEKYANSSVSTSSLSRHYR